MMKFNDIKTLGSFITGQPHQQIRELWVKTNDTQAKCMGLWSTTPLGGLATFEPDEPVGNLIIGT